jgi:SPX domain protein involved in polyphosphate accumulation
MRYEIKIPVSSVSAGPLECVIKLNRACYTTAYPERRINNIYFDDYNHSSYYDNVDGLEKRIKYRVRWYGEKYGKIDPVLELKIKEGRTGYKKSYKLNDFIFEKTSTSNQISKIILQNQLPEEIIHSLSCKNPVVYNSYLRKYYVSSDKKIRLTLDYNIEYGKINTISSDILRKDDLIILEFKFSPDDHESARRSIAEFPYRQDKNSKFVRGLISLTE